LKALAGRSNLGRTHVTGLLVASAIFILLGGYGLAFSALYEQPLVPLIVLSFASVATGLGLLLERRFALWLSFLIFPLGIVQALATLSYSVEMSGWYPSYTVAAFNASLILYSVGSVVSLILVIDKRSQLK
jgi:hypothetical protein